MSSPPQRPRLWPHLRALFVVLHVAAIVLVAIPAPQGGMNRKAWKQPTVQAEFAAWGDRLRGMGLSLTNDELEDHLWSFAGSYMRIRNRVLAPTRPYTTYLGTSQSWRMFVAPHRHPSRLEVAVQRGDDWEVVYLQTRPGPDWLEHILEHDRTRSVLFRYAWPAYRGRYKRFSQWLATRAAADFPDAEQVRVRWLRQRSPSPAQVRAHQAPPVTPHGERVYRASTLREAP